MLQELPHEPDFPSANPDPANSRTINTIASFLILKSLHSSFANLSGSQQPTEPINIRRFRFWQISWARMQNIIELLGIIWIFNLSIVEQYRKISCEAFQKKKLHEISFA